MDVQRDTSPVSVITVSRQYGSEGGKIAAQLASRLHWQLTDHEIVAQVARALGISEEEAIGYDEHTYSFPDRMLLSFQMAFTEVWPNQYTIPNWPLSQERRYHEVLQHVVKTVAQADRIVIAGHGVQAILANRPDALHIRVVAPFLQRVQRVMQIEQWDEARSRACVRQKDRDQAHYLRSQYHRNINDPLLYDLVINSEALNLESQVDLICLALERKANRLP